MIGMSTSTARMSEKNSPITKNVSYISAAGARTEPQILHVLLRGILDLLDALLHLHFPRRRLMGCVAHHTVAPGLANIEKKFIAFSLRVFEFFIVALQLRNRFDHIAAIREHRYSVGVEQRVA